MAQESSFAGARAGRADSPALATNAEGRSGRGIWAKLAIAALVLAALAATLSYEQDFDAFWHMACGNWMLQHQRVLNFDPFVSEPEFTPDDPRSEWVNVYWLFQLAMAALHSVGGWPILTVFQCLLSGAAFAGLALSLRKEVPAAWLVPSGLVVLTIFASRIRIRPEMFTLPLLLTVTVLVDGVRRGGPARRLWWLVPMMLTWVNMHGLYFLGLVVAWGAMIGAAIDSRIGRKSLAGNLATQAALAPVLAATAACLVSPWPLEAALHPLRLWSRISGQAFYYTYGVSEFRPTWENLGAEKELLVLVGLTVLVLLLNARKAPLAHLFWMAPFLVLAAMAVRNIALLSAAFAVPLAWHGGSVLRRIGAAKPRLARIAPAASAVMFLAALAVAGAFATEYAYRLRGLLAKTGAGLCPNYYSTALAQYLGKLDAPGDVLSVDFGDASAFIYYSDPRRNYWAGRSPPYRKVWMDGRLEIKTFERFKRYYDISKELRTPAGADRVALPDSARFFPVGHVDREHLSALAQSGRFRLIRLDGVSACFVRLDWPDPRTPGQAAGELPSGPNLGDFDLPLDRSGLIQAVAPHPFHWYRQNPRSGYLLFADMMCSLGETPGASRPGEATLLQKQCTRLAVRYYQGGMAEGAVAPNLVGGFLAQALQQWSRQTAQQPDATVPIDVDLARALFLYSQVDLPSLPPETRWMLGNFQVKALLQGRHLDAAVEAVAELAKLLPPFQQLNPPIDYTNMRNALLGNLEVARASLAGENLRDLPPLRRAQLLTMPERGLTLEAIRELKGVPNLDPAGRLALGDLLLKLGRPGEARKQYQASSVQGGDLAAAEIRLALCDWVEGDLFKALDELGGAETYGGVSSGPARGAQGEQFCQRLYYKGLLLEELGHYPRAKDALRAAASGASGELARRIEQGMERL